MRVFVAVDISEEAREQAARRIELLRNSFTDLRVGWDKPEKLHLTLKFLGEVNAEQFNNLNASIERIAQNFSPFSVKIAGAGAFPARGDARVLWLGVRDEANSLRKLQNEIENECEKIGFEREKRDFKPHLTIARLKEPQKSRSLAELHNSTDFPAIGFEVREITIYESKLLPGGSVYSVLARQQFQG